MQDNYLKITYPTRTKYSNYLAAYIYTHYLMPESILVDIGCGTGEYVTAFRQLGIKAVGVDKRIDNTELGFYSCNIETEQLPFPSNSVDVVFSKSTIEHITNIENFFKEIYRVLKVGGKVILMTPDWQSCYRDFYIDYSHTTPFTTKALRDALKIFNFKNVAVNKFYQYPLLWKRPYLTFITKLISILVPDKFKWKDKEQTIQREWVRFSKELLLLGVGVK